MAALTESVFFGSLLSLTAYFLGMWLKEKTKMAWMNPLLLSIVFVIVFLLVCNIDYETYNNGAKYVSYLLSPATVALAIPLYRQFHLLKKNAAAILVGITSGVITSIITITLFALLFHFERAAWITFLPKSITTAIAMGLSEELGGYVSITVTAVVLTGVFGNIVADFVCRLFRITNPIAKGIGIGTAAHAVGTSKAMEMGEVEGAMSSLSIVVSGILTVILATIVTNVF